MDKDLKTFLFGFAALVLIIVIGLIAINMQNNSKATTPVLSPNTPYIANIEQVVFEDGSFVITIYGCLHGQLCDTGDTP